MSIRKYVDCPHCGEEHIVKVTAVLDVYSEEEFNRTGGDLND